MVRPIHERSLEHSPPWWKALRCALVVMMFAMSLATPFGVIAQEDGAPVSDTPIEVLAEIAEEPPVEPETKSEPEQIPEKPLPESEMPPAENEPQPAPEAPVLEVPATGRDTTTDTTGTVEEPIVWVNTDSLRLVDGTSDISLSPGASQTLTLGYAVTTPRTSTTIHAQLVDAPAGWSLASPDLADADASETSAAWTQTTTVEPGTSFNLSLVITTPAVVAETHTVSLLIWSTATVETGEEIGVAQSGSPILTATAVAPPIVNTDSLQLNGETSQSIASGESVTVSLTYNVTTPRQGTTVHAELVDEAGNAVEGWTLDAPEVTDASSLLPGTAFTADFAVTAPDFVEVAHTVSFRIWSEASTGAGSEAGVSAQDVATIAVAATPAKPAIACKPGEGEAITCILDADRADVTGGILTISGIEGWTYAVNGTSVPESGVLDLGSVMPDSTLTGAISIVPGFGAGCADPALERTATIVVDYAYTNVAAARAETSVSFAMPTPVPAVPSVSIAPLDFGVLTWDGSSWGTAEAETTVTITREGCGDLGAYDIQIQLLGDTPGFDPVLTGGASANADIEIVETSSDPNVVPVTVARVTSSFTGTAEITLEFQLTPGSEVTVGTHQKEINVTTINAP